MGNLSNVNTEERPQMIILGVLTLYFLICGFILYLYFLHRITFLVTLVVCMIIYIPLNLLFKMEYAGELFNRLSAKLVRK